MGMHLGRHESQPRPFLSEVRSSPDALASLSPINSIAPRLLHMSLAAIFSRLDTVFVMMSVLVKRLIACWNTHLARW